MRPGSDSYGAERMPVSQGLSQGRLESALGGQLGETGYKDTLAEREFNQNMALANATSDAMRPSLLMQVLSGIGGAADVGGQYAALRKMMPQQTNRFSMGSSPFPQGDPSMNMPISYPMYRGGY